MAGGSARGWRNDADRYGVISIALHWAVAGIVLALLATAAWAWLAPSEDAAGDRLQVHGSIGSLGLIVIAARIIWYFIDRRPVSLARPPLDRVARITHVALLVLIATQLVTGPVDIWTGGWPIGVFGWFAISSPLAGAGAGWHDAIGTVHRYTGYAVAVLLGLHIAAAAKHLLIDRDGAVQRMLGIDRSTAPPSPHPANQI